MRNEKIAKIDEKQRRTAKISPLDRKSISQNTFPVTDLRPEVKSLHLTAHAQTLSLRKSSKAVSRVGSGHILTGKLLHSIQI